MPKNGHPKILCGFGCMGEAVDRLGCHMAALDWLLHALRSTKDARLLWTRRGDTWQPLRRFGALRRSFFGGLFRRVSVRGLPWATPKEFLGHSCACVSMTGRATFLVFTASLHSKLFVGFTDHLVIPFSTVDFWTAEEYLWDFLVYRCRNGTCEYSICIYSSRGSQR